MVLGEPEEVFAWGEIGYRGVDEAVIAPLRFSSRRTAVVDCELRIVRREEAEIVGTDGRLLVPKAFPPGDADPYPPVDAVANVAVMEAIVRSLHSGHPEAMAR